MTTAEPPQAIDPNFRIQLPNFEGPLDLLLHLIQKHELDVLDLPVAFVTEKYLEYLGLMERLNLDVAAEYLVMAATLAHIKSKMLLPQVPEDQDELEEDELDPRAELIRRLLEYQKYKKAAEQLGSRGVAGRDVFPRGTDAPSAQGEAPLAPISLFKLIDAFQKLAQKVQGEMALEVSAERITIQERINQVAERLKATRKCQFEQLFEGLVTRYDMVVTFLALLEMAKMRMLKVYQTEPEAPLYLEYRLLDEEATGEGSEGEGGGAAPYVVDEYEASPGTAPAEAEALRPHDELDDELEDDDELDDELEDDEIEP